MSAELGPSGSESKDEPRQLTEAKDAMGAGINLMSAEQWFDVAVVRVGKFEPPAGQRWEITPTGEPLQIYQHLGRGKVKYLGPSNEPFLAAIFMHRQGMVFEAFDRLKSPRPKFAVFKPGVEIGLKPID